MAKDRPLTTRQHQILRMVARGATNKEIAAALRISEQGVKAHISRLLERYGAANRVELVSVTRAWSESDQRGYASLAAEVDGVRSNLRRGEGAELPARAPFSPNAPSDLSAAIRSLRTLLTELDVAMRLATEIQADAKDSLLEAVRARTRVALEHSDRLALIVAGQLDRSMERDQVAT